MAITTSNTNQHSARQQPKKQTQMPRLLMSPIHSKRVPNMANRENYTSMTAHNLQGTVPAGKAKQRRFNSAKAAPKTGSTKAPVAVAHLHAQTQKRVPSVGAKIAIVASKIVPHVKPGTDEPPSAFKCKLVQDKDGNWAMATVYEQGMLAFFSERPQETAKDAVVISVAESGNACTLAVLT